MWSFKLICFSLNVLFIFESSYGKISAAENEGTAVNVEFDAHNFAKGEFKLAFETSDGVEREEIGGFDDKGNYVVNGYYSYVDKNGYKNYVKYWGDRDGYHMLPTKEDVRDALPPRIVASMLGG